MDCSCVYLETNNEFADFSKTLTPIARKQHICVECGRTIQKGEKYEVVSGLWDGEFSTFKTCSDCLCVREEFFCDGYIYGTIWDDLHTHIDYIDGEVSSDCLLRLPEKVRWKVMEIIDKCFERSTTWEKY